MKKMTPNSINTLYPFENIDEFILSNKLNLYNSAWQFLLAMFA